MIARRVRVTGRVQGVFFRAWTLEEAARLGLSGWVRNCTDGSVEVHVEGEDSAVEKLIHKMRNGPPLARVEHLSSEDTAPEHCSGFELRH